MVKRILNSLACSYRGWRKERRNKREMKACKGTPIRVEQTNPRDAERRRIMRGNGPGQGWRNY